MTINRASRLATAAMSTVLAILAGSLCALPAAAQSQGPRTYVASTGSDSAACIRTAPCRTFSAAYEKTGANGEIDCLDAGNYGPLIIAKSIRISCNGVANAGIQATSGDTILIQAGANDTVVIDGLQITGVKSAATGIRLVSGGTLTLRNIDIRDYIYEAIIFQPTGATTLTMENVVASGSNTGLYVNPTGAGSARVTVLRSTFSGNGDGVQLDGNGTTAGLFVSIRGSSVSNNRRYGIITSSGNMAANATVALDDAIVSGNGGVGLVAQFQRSGMLVNNSTITNNLGGGVVPADGGVIYSYGNNRVNGNNGKDGSFTATLSQR